MTAVEFALVATPFLLTLFAIFEIFLLFFAQVTMENATARISRIVRTGEVQATEMTAEDYRQLLCNNVSPFLACDERLQVDVRTYEDFNDADFTPPIKSDGTLDTSFQFNPGQAGDVVLVRAFYVWEPTTPFLGPLFSNMGGGHYLMGAAAAFRNEPFAAGAGSWTD